MNKDYLILLLVLILFGINIYYFTSINLVPPKWDESVHLRDSFVFYNILSNPSHLSYSVIKEIINKSDQYPLIRPSGYYPPLAPALTSLFYFIFSMSAKIAVMSNLIFLFILVFSIYKTGSLLFDQNTGLLASVLILLFPIVLQHSIIYYLDLPLTAFTALCTLVLLNADNFKNTRFSIIAGLCFGLGMLSKWTFLFFILGPLIYTLSRAFLSEGEGGSAFSFSKKTFKNISVFVLVSTAAFGFYYIPIISQLLKETFKYSHGPLSHGPGNILSFDSMIFYLTALWNEMINPLGFALFLSGLFFLFYSKNAHRIFFTVWIVVPLLIFTFLIQTKTSRFMMPWLIPVSLIISFGIMKISSIKIKNYKQVVGKYTVLLAVLLFFILFLGEDLKLSNSVIKASQENWNLKEIVNVIEIDMIKNKSVLQSKGKLIYLGTIPDHYFINGQTIRYYAALKQMSINVIKLQDYSDAANEKFEQQFNRYDYILTKDRSNIVIPSFQKSIDNMDTFFYSHIADFEMLKTFREPDGSDVSIFRKKK